MRQFKLPFIVLALLLLIGLDNKLPAWQDSAGNEPAKWHTTLEAATAESLRTGKPILMEINGRPWCPPCNAHGKKVNDQASFQKWARERVVLLDVKVGKGYDKKQGNPIWPEQMKKYKLASIPTCVLLTPSGQRMGIVYPQDDVQQWLGAANNVLTSHAMSQGQPQVVPFRLTRWNNISVPATLNKSISLNLMFHIAVDSLSLTKATVERFPEIVLNQNVDVKSWGGQSTSRFGKGHSLRIGQLQSRPVTVFEDLHSGHGTDGKFGPEQLKSRILKIDFDQSEIRLLPKLPRGVQDWQKVRLETERGMMFISASVQSGEKNASHKFMIHSGYSGFALLDDEFAGKHAFLKELEIIDESSVKDSAGNELTTKKVSLPKFAVGETEFSNVPVSFFSGAIGKQKFSVLGGDFLKRFNLILDMDSQTLYLQRSQHFGSKFY
ncbi:MAG: thioredoxin family protein [Planctomycetota bacterium]